MVEVIKMAPGKYRLLRTYDGSGDAGPMLVCKRVTKDMQIEEKPQGELHLDFRVVCGSLFARTFSQQDFWCTTEIRKFEKYDSETGATIVRFKTTNSTYLCFNVDVPESVVKEYLDFKSE